MMSSPTSQTRSTTSVVWKTPEPVNTAQPAYSGNARPPAPFSPESMEAIVDALRQSMAANAALEAAVKMQAEDIRRQAMELSAMRKENSDLQLKLRAAEALNGADKQPCGPPPTYEDAAVGQDYHVVYEPKEVFKGTDVAVQTDAKTRKRRSPSAEGIHMPKHDMKPMTLQNTSPLIAEAFRLGWLAGADAKPKNDSEPSTRSDDTISEPVTESVSTSSSSPHLKESLPSRSSTPTPVTPRSNDA